MISEMRFFSHTLLRSHEGSNLRLLVRKSRSFSTRVNLFSIDYNYIYIYIFLNLWLVKVAPSILPQLVNQCYEITSFFKGKKKKNHWGIKQK